MRSGAELRRTTGGTAPLTGVAIRLGRTVLAIVLLTLYAKSTTDNLTAAVLKEIRRALED